MSSQPAVTISLYVTVSNLQPLLPVLGSLQEAGAVFNAPADRAQAYSQQGLDCQALPMEAFLKRLEADTVDSSDEASTRWIILLDDYAVPLNTVDRALQVALYAALTGFRQNTGSNCLAVINQPEHYRFLDPSVVSDEAHWQSLCALGMQPQVNEPVMMMPQVTSPIFEGSLYASNPSIPQSLSIVSSGKAQLHSGEFKNVLAGVSLLVELARTPELYPHYAILLQNGQPVQVACDAGSSRQLLNRLLWQDSLLCQGATLVLSRKMNLTDMETVSATGISIVVCPEWDMGVVDSASAEKVVCVQIAMESLRFSASQWQALPSQILWAENTLGADEQIQWWTSQRPDETKRVDMEFGVTISQALDPVSVILIDDQATLGIYGSGALLTDTLERSLQRLSGETSRAVCIIKSDTLSEDCLSILAQAGVAGVLFINAPTLPASWKASLKSLPFFIGRTQLVQTDLSENNMLQQSHQGEQE